jgi:hypothetical protein
MNLFQSAFDVRQKKAISGRNKQMITLGESSFPLQNPLPHLAVLAKSDNSVE